QKASIPNAERIRLVPTDAVDRPPLDCVGVLVPGVEGWLADEVGVPIGQVGSELRIPLWVPSGLVARAIDHAGAAAQVHVLAGARRRRPILGNDVVHERAKATHGHLIVVQAECADARGVGIAIAAKEGACGYAADRTTIAGGVRIDAAVEV